MMYVMYMYVHMYVYMTYMYMYVRMYIYLYARMCIFNVCLYVHGSDPEFKTMLKSETL